MMTAIAYPVSAPFDCETFRFHLRMRTLAILPPYKGAVFRGAFGNSFQRLVCPLPDGDCDNCHLKSKCLFISLFKPPPPPDFQDSAKFADAPPPYVLAPPDSGKQSFKPGDTMTFDMTLIGRALTALPYFVFTFVQIGRRGLGKERGRYDLDKVDLLRNGKSRLVYDGQSETLTSFPPDKEPVVAETTTPVETITLHLQTPLRLKQKGDLVTRLDFATFFEALSRRLTLLNAFYGENNTPPDFNDLINRAADIRTAQDNTFWYDWPRYSSRQKELMKLGGLRGEITFKGDLTAFVPWLKLGERVHVGQGTSFGLGKMRCTQALIEETPLTSFTVSNMT